MSYVAAQRIKHGGKYYAAGEPIELNEKDLAQLPNGAVVAGTVEETAPPKPLSDEEKANALLEAVVALTDADFKTDGNIRADSLKVLIKTLGFDVTAEDVAELKNGGNE